MLMIYHRQIVNIFYCKFGPIIFNFNLKSHETTFTTNYLIDYDSWHIYVDYVAGTQRNQS